MKKEIVYTDKYALILSDEKPLPNEWFLDAYRNIYRMPDVPILGLEYERDEIKKIAFHLPLSDAPILKGVPLLPSFSWSQQDDVEELAKSQFRKSEYEIKLREEAFQIGYNKAIEKYKFTEEDAKYLFECGRNFQINADITFTVAREHLSQPKIPTHFEFEIERKSVLNLGIEPFNPNTHVYTNEPKTTTNSQGQIELVGKYLNL